MRKLPGVGNNDGWRSSEVITGSEWVDLISADAKGVQQHSPRQSWLASRHPGSKKLYSSNPKRGFNKAARHD